MMKFIGKLSLPKLSLPKLGRAGRFAAIDFDSRRLRIALAESTASGTRITSLLGRDVGEDVDVGDPQAFGQFLGETLKDAGFRGAGVVMSIPRSEAVLKPLSLPPGTADEEMASMVHFQVEKELPFPAPDAAIDFICEAHYDAQAGDDEGLRAPGEIRILVAAVRLSVVDYYRRLAEAAGVKLLRLGLRPYADMRCVEACEQAAGSRQIAIVHITADETEIDVLSDGALAFSRSAIKEVGPAATADELDDAVHSVVMEVARSLQSFQAISRGIRIDDILVAGETGIESSTAEEITRRLGTPCRMLEPARAFAGRIEGDVPSQFVSALGSAVAHPAGSELPFDFLNPKRSPPRRDPVRQRNAAIALGAIVILMICIGGGWLYLGSKQSAYDRLITQQNELKKDIKAAGKLAKRVEAIENWQSQRRNWLDYLGHLSVLVPDPKDIYVTSIRTGSDGAISFAVQAKSHDAITLLGKRIIEGGYRFTPGPIRSGNDPHGYAYNTTIKISVPAENDIDLSAVKPVERPKDDSSRKDFYGESSRKPGRSSRRARR